MKDFFTQSKCQARLSLAVLLLAPRLIASTFVVTTSSDSGPGSLRQAILDANAAPGGGQITFSNLTGTIVLSNQLPSLTNSIQILGSGPDQLAVQGPAIFTNAFGNTAVLTGLTMQNARNGIANLGTFILSNCRIANCSSGSPAVPSWLAPGIYNAGTLQASNCTLSGNFTFVDKDGVAIHNSGTMSLAFCAITNNSGNFVTGSGIYNEGILTADNCIISGNGGQNTGAGGIYNQTGSVVVLRNCSITHNGSDNAGGIENDGWLAMTNCTLANNAATYSDGAQTGGGLYNTGYAALQNTTVSGNDVGPSGYGAGIWNDGVTVLLNSTIVSNQACCRQPQPCTGVGVWNSGVVRSRNSIFAGNMGYTNTIINGSPVFTSCNADFYGNLDSLGHNVIQEPTGWTNVGSGSADLVGVDPKLGPLQDNGGPTWTHALLPNSPAIDAGDSYEAPTTDQRGVMRPQGLGVDIGAFEYECTIPLFKQVAKDGLFIFLQACGMPLQPYTLQASSNFLVWQDIRTSTTGTNGLVQFYDFRDAIQCFYRLKGTAP